MSEHDHTTWEERPRDRLLASRTELALLGFLVIVGVLLSTEHRAHVLGALIWLLPLACIMMHIFMHGGRRSHRSHDKNAP